MNGEDPRVGVTPVSNTVQGDGGPNMPLPSFFSNPMLSQVSSRVTHFFGTKAGLPVRNGDLPVGVVGTKPPTFPLVIRVKQVHGAEALVLDHAVAAGETCHGEWDALITNQPGLLLTIGTADCVPVLVYDRHCHVVAAIHSGWRGTLQNIVPKTLHRMREHFGTHMRDVHVGIGPSAGVCCYEVDEPVLKSFSDMAHFGTCVAGSCTQGKGNLDLRGVIRRQLMEVGVLSQEIEVVDLCTICRPDLFFSYRRTGHARDTMLSGVMLLEKE